LKSNDGGQLLFVKYRIMMLFCTPSLKYGRNVVILFLNSELNYKTSNSTHKDDSPFQKRRVAKQTIRFNVFLLKIVLSS